MKSYALVLETLDCYPSLSFLDFRSTAAGLGKEDGYPSCRHPERNTSPAARLRERGSRMPRDIRVESYDQHQLADMAVAAAAESTIPRRQSVRESYAAAAAAGTEAATAATAAGAAASSSASTSSEAGCSKETTPSECCSSRSRNRSSKELSPGDQDRLHFISGNPFVEVTKGIIHLFKETTTTATSASNDNNDKLSSLTTRTTTTSTNTSSFPDTELMCMWGVPAQHKTPDLLQFTAPCHADLVSLRVIHDGSPNLYMVLLRFRSAAAAREFHAAYNGLPYNTMEPEVCCVLPVAWVEHCKESEYYPVGEEAGTELPYCTICLERMDESVSTVLTILCNHKFHSGCLAQWEDPTCPVCRHVQTPEVMTEHLCSDCQSCSDLWICLVCGYVGCGRYAGGHAHQHFLDTQHCYSMELGHNRVWDYVGDNFVHRLVQNTSDGKLVEQEAGGGEEGKQRRVGGLAVDTEEKVDSLQLEYTYLLTSQLESQRAYFESKLARVEEEAGRELSQLTSRAKAAQEERNKIQEDLEHVVREKTKMEGKMSNLVAKLGKISTELEEERQLNRSLRQNQEDWQVRLKRTECELSVIRHQKEEEIRELREQVRDLMFYLEAQGKVAESPLRDEIQGGSIVMGAAAAAEDQTPKKKGARKRKS